MVAEGLQGIMNADEVVQGVERLAETREQIERAIADTKGKISVLWQEIGAAMPMFAYNDSRRVSAASTIKVAIMAALLEDIRAGKRTPGDLLFVPQAGILDDTEVFDTGERDASLFELMTWMIVSSDNTATNVLIEAAGMDAVNAYCAGIGLKDTVLGRRMLDFDARGRGLDNHTSARDQYILYNKLCRGEILDERLCADALGILRKQRSGDILRRYIWEDVAVAHKTGGLDHLCHDAGVFFLPQKTVATGAAATGAAAYFLGVFLEGPRAKTATNGSRGAYPARCTITIPLEECAFQVYNIEKMEVE
nr:Beta-lactamase [uncultured bacterium]